jgi:hypothetical protein
MKFQYFTFLALLALFAASCAQTYRPINPQKINYTYADTTGGIIFAYEYNVLGQTGNHKYAKKAQKKNMRLAAVKLTNTTDSVINVQQLTFFNGHEPITPLSGKAMKAVIGQRPPAHLLYLLLIFSGVFIQDNETGTREVIPIGWVLGPAISLGNLGVSNAANKNFVKTIDKQQITPQSILPKGTVYGLIGFQSKSYHPITVAAKR